MANIKELGLIGAIDCHTHSGGIDYYNMYRGRLPYVQSVDDLVLKAESAGIDKVVTFPLPSSGYFNPRSRIENGTFEPSLLQNFPYEIENQMLIKSCEDYKKQVIPFLCIDPVRKTKEQLELLSRFWEEKKFFGLKLHTAATGTKATDILSSPIGEFIEKNNLPIVIHTGITDIYSDPMNCIQLAEALPNVRISIAHMAMLNNEVLDKIRIRKNVFTDCCPWLQLCYFATRGSSSVCAPNFIDTASPVQSLFKYYQLLGEHLVWGTDEPWTKLVTPEKNIESRHSYKEETDLLANLYKISPKAAEDITVRNSMKFIFG
jgi:predicted TIM-barrel fold metal-dependent hydrolase